MATVWAFMGAISFDMTLNILQDWYYTMYNDAFWTHPLDGSSALGALAAEEEQINALLRAHPDFATRQVVIPEIAGTVEPRR